jgi:ATP-dependent DNA helicase RecG
MKELELHKYLKENFPHENEKCEWKEFKNFTHAVAGREGDDIISYISAIANMKGGHLVIGVEDKSLKIVGIQNFHTYTAQSIRVRLLDNCPNLCSEGFEIEEQTTEDTKKTVWIFHIPKHPYRLPVYAHKKCWQRVNDSLVAITQSRLDAILTEVRTSEDWSSEIVLGATIDDLDNEAIQKARIEFVKRNPKYKSEEPNWDTAKFLNKAKLTVQGKITRTALILLGKEESEHFLGSAVKIRWSLRTVSNQDKAFEVYSIPLLLAVDQVYQSIRNLKYVYLKDGTLFPDEFLRYEPFNIREPLNNAIAHQDYTKHAYINVMEFEDDHLVFSNYGSFLPKSIEDVVLNDTPEASYRNPFLVAAMKNLDMIETQGGGLRKIFNFQRQRCFPMPDFDLSDGKFKVTVTGKILNEDFARILIKNPTLSLEDILTLDKVQKQKPVPEGAYAYLRKQKFVEGRKPAIYLSYKVIEPTKDENLMAEYVNNKSFDDEYFKKLILEYIKKQGKTRRKAIENLIIPKLSAVLSDEQKKNKVTNFLKSLRIGGKIKSLPGYLWEDI